MARRDIDLPALIERTFARRPAQFAWFLLFALLTRVSTFGDLDYHNDELLFLLIGQRMHDGLLPYVDLWDRKGPGLFLVYYLATAFSRSVLAYQVAAWLFAAGTALVAQMIAERFAARIGALLAGTLYLVLLPLFAGGGGQAPVFYNLFMALAVLGLANGRAAPAMLSAGFAVTFKQTAAVEACFLGLFALWQLHRAGTTPGALAARALKLALLGALPMATFAAFFALAGHFAEFWHAMVTSNLTKTYDPAGDLGKRATALATILAPALIAALPGCALIRRPEQRLLIGGWLIAALVGVAMVPNYIDHYVLPLALPVSVAAAPALGFRRIGPVYGYAIVLFGLLAGPALHFADRQASRAAMERIAADIRARDPHPRLFVFQGPVHLYSMLRSYPPSPLLFPMHLFHRPERNTSHLDTAAEVRKILAWNPTVVVTAADFPRAEDNPETTALVSAYLRRCRDRLERRIIDYYGPQTIAIHSRCAASGPRLRPAVIKVSTLSFNKRRHTSATPAQGKTERDRSYHERIRAS